MTAARSCSSPTACRPTVPARSRRSTPARRSSSRCSAAAPPRHRRRRRPRRAAPPRHASARSTRSPRAAATAPSSPGPPGAPRCPRPGSAPAARACRSSCGARCGPSCAPRPTSRRARSWPPSTATPRPSWPTGRTSRRSPARTAPAGSRSRRRRSTTPSGPHRPTRRSAARRSRSCSSGATRREKGVAPLLAAWRAAGWTAARRCSWSPARATGRRAGVPGVEVVGALEPRICATSMPAPALWPYRRSPRRASWSHGGSSPTRP